VNNPRFIQGDFDTTFVDQEYLGKKPHQDGFQEFACIAAAIRAYQKDRKEIAHGL
jgi:hypothetical protein